LVIYAPALALNQSEFAGGRVLQKRGLNRTLCTGTGVLFEFFLLEKTDPKNLKKEETRCVFLLNKGGKSSIKKTKQG